jgi:membrane protein YdbS with pleckstrin-like domain
MVRIELTETIAAPIERVFDLARSIDLHVKTAGRTQEQAIEGRTSGLIGLARQ